MAQLHMARNDLKTKYERSKVRRRQMPHWLRITERIAAAVLLVVSLLGFWYILKNPASAMTLSRELSSYSGALCQRLFEVFRGSLPESALFLLIPLGLLFGLYLWMKEAFRGFWDFLIRLLLICGIFALFFSYLILAGIYLLPIGTGLLAVFWLVRNIRNSGFLETEESRILRAGLEGEAEALSILKRLGRSCHVYANLRIPHGSAESETDLIVVAPAGITVIEVKNHKGTIAGDTSDEELAQYKSKSRTQPTKTFHNPIHQVGIHRSRLEKFLQGQGIEAPVRRCVLFVHPEVRLELTDTKQIAETACPVFTRQTRQQLLRYVSKGQTSLNARLLQQTVNALNTLTEQGLSAEQD